MVARSQLPDGCADLTEGEPAIPGAFSAGARRNYFQPAKINPAIATSALITHNPPVLRQFGTLAAGLPQVDY
jgi:hypothetical protein